MRRLRTDAAGDWREALARALMIAAEIDELAERGADAVKELGGTATASGLGPNLRRLSDADDTTGH